MYDTTLAEEWIDPGFPSSYPTRTKPATGLYHRELETAIANDLISATKSIGISERTCDMAKVAQSNKGLMVDSLGSSSRSFGRIILIVDMSDSAFSGSQYIPCRQTTTSFSQ